MTFRADLHCHTICSDGSMTPRELICHAKEIGLSGLSITDHDNVRAYPEAIEVARALGVCLGTGVEFSSVHDGHTVHILGYDIDPWHPDLETFCHRHMERRRQRNRVILAKLASHGMRVDEASLSALLAEGVPVGRPHIALQLVERGYVKDVQEAFNRYLGDGRCCFDPGSPISAQDTIGLIHQVGGKAFLAHPHLFKNRHLISSLLLLLFDGIECYYSRLGSQQEARWIRLAQRWHLLKSGGSDFHGVVKPMTPLGSSWVDEETFDRIFERHRWKV